MGYSSYKNKIRDIRDVVGGMFKDTSRVVIYQEFTDDNGVMIEFPSVLNGYLKKYKNQSLSNSKNAADVICPFLNYCKDMAEDDSDDEFSALKENGFVGLNFYHAASYLNYCIDFRRIGRSTAMAYTEQLLSFYEWFVQLGILDKKKIVFKYKISYLPKKKKRGQVRENPFKDARYYVSYPDKAKGKKKKLNNLEEALWQHFLLTSEMVEPDITLGIAFGFFGGLRRGEIVNLAIQDMIHIIRRDRYGILRDTTKMDIEIKDRQKDFFLGKKYKSIKMRG